MKKSQLKQIILEEVQQILSENNPNIMQGIIKELDTIAKQIAALKAKLVANSSAPAIGRAQDPVGDPRYDDDILD